MVPDPLAPTRPLRGNGVWRTSADTLPFREEGVLWARTRGGRWIPSDHLVRTLTVITRPSPRGERRPRGQLTCSGVTPGTEQDSHLCWPGAKAQRPLDVSPSLATLRNPCSTPSLPCLQRLSTLLTTNHSIPWPGEAGGAWPRHADPASLARPRRPRRQSDFVLMTHQGSATIQQVSFRLCGRFTDPTVNLRGLRTFAPCDPEFLLPSSRGPVRLQPEK